MSGTGTNSQRDARMKTARLRARSFEVDFNRERESPSSKQNSDRDRVNLNRSRSGLPDGVGGTITGGPMPPVDLAGILGRSRVPRLVPPIAFGGAVSGAARSMDGFTPAIARGDRGIALSDGSRIIFSSVGDMAERTDA